MEKFTKDYVDALKANDVEAMTALIGTLDTDEAKAAGLKAVIEAVEADKDVIEGADKILENLSTIQEMNTSAKIYENVSDMKKDEAAVTDCAVKAED